jgi:phosphohistidine phosphatase
VRRLHLLRHAKSSWDDPGLADHDRPLAPRGRRAATRVRERLGPEGVRPQLVLCSTATRATQTLDLLQPALGNASVSIEDGLYHATAARLSDRVQLVPDDVTEVLLVGHNPALQDLALLLAEPSAARDRVAAKLPTGALVTLELDASSWDAVRPGSAKIVSLLLPRELTQEG